jgi:hypothetical protein
MNLNHLLVDGVQADREVEIATRRLASQLTAAKAHSALRTTRPASRLRRFLLSI